MLADVLSEPEKRPTVEILEAILGFVSPAHIAHHQARMLIAEYGELRHVLAQKWETLITIGLSIEAADMLLLLKQIGLHLFGPDEWFVERQIIDSLQRAITYFKTICANRQGDWVGFLFLDVKAGVLRSQIFDSKDFSFDETATKTIVQMALKENASGLIVALGRTGTTIAPTTAEVRAIRGYAELGQSLGLRIHELLIFNDDKVASYFEIVDPTIKQDNLTEGDVLELIKTLQIYITT